MKNLYYKIGAGITMLSALLPTAAGAADTTGLSGAQSQLGTTGDQLGGVGQKSLPELVGTLINAFLGVLGIIFVILVIYAGFLYMTAAGEDEKVKKAKSLLVQAVIGMIIIIASYAIANFVINMLVTATG